MPALYSALLPDLIRQNPDELLGLLTSGLAREGFDTTTSNTFSWQHEIEELQAAFRELPDMRASRAAPGRGCRSACEAA